MERRIQPGIALSHHPRNKVSRGRQSLEIDSPILQRAVERQHQHALRAFAHRRRTQEGTRLIGQGGS
jgi:hypothetical protein